jgi:GDP-L-fucose synthase
VYEAAVPYWADKRVTVTGGAGFLGSFVTGLLQVAGAKVSVPRSAEFDLRDRLAVQRLYQRDRPDHVFHLAAKVGGIGANLANAGTFFYDNLMMGMNVLHEAQALGVSRVLAVGTICAYPKFCPVPFHEDDLWNGYPEETNAPYGIAKKALSVMSDAYRRQFGFRSTVVYPVNLYGPRDNFDLASSHVIPAMIRKFLEARASGAAEVVLWGDGSATREFLYVEDCAKALLLAAEKYDASEPVNLGSGEEISIRDLASLIAGAAGFSGRFVWDASKPNGQPRRRLEVSRARERFGFAAQTRLAEGIARTIAWYRQERA